VCKIEGCGKRVEARELCKKHYQLWWRAASPDEKRVMDGRRKHPLYTIYALMLSRCYCKSNQDFHLYGERSILVCERWRNDFWAFVSDMGPRPSPKHSIDRYPNQNGNYEPGNVRWATQTEQCRNQCRNNLITVNNKTQPLAAWAEETNLKRYTIFMRIKRGWSAEDAVSFPVMRLRRKRCAR
jgi:hypothetical protein